jgi:hypothetical protein
VHGSPEASTISLISKRSRACNSLVLMFLVNKYIRDAVIDFSSLEKIMSSLNISVAFTNCLKTIILLFYVAYLALSILGVYSLKQRTRFSDLALDGSNYYKACVWDYDYFPLELPIQVVFQSPVKYAT